MYDPKQFWERRGRNYTTPNQLQELAAVAEMVRALAPASILEIGSGYGRVFNHLKPLGLAGSYTMCDFADSMRARCKRDTGTLPDNWDGITLPYDDDSFDLVLTLSVFLHVPPDHVRRFLVEQVRVSGRYIYVATLREWPRPLGGPGSHCFTHDNLALFEDAGVEVLEERQFGMRSHWLVEVPEK